MLSGVRATSEKRKVRKDERWASEEALLAEQIPSVSTRKRLRIGYNLESFSVKSAFVGINPLSWMKSLCDEICLMAGYGEADLISSEALAEDFIQTRLDFILQSRISFLLLFQIRFHFNSSVFNFVSFSPITLRKRLRIGYNLESFSTKSTLSGGLNRIHDEIPLAWDEIRLDGGWVDLISSKQSLDFILAFVSNLCYTCSNR